MEAMHDAITRDDVVELGGLLDEDPGLIEGNDDDEETPLYCAAAVGSVGAARLLLDRGADVNARDCFSWTPLMEACSQGHVGMAALLLERGAEPSARTRTGSTALVKACNGDEHPGSDHVAVIRLLIEDGRVAVDARDDEGCTALWCACLYGYTERARVLLLEGLADHTVADWRGRTPLALAQRQQEEGCTRLLQWYEGELHRAFLLNKARAVLDATHSITKAPDKAQAQTQAEAQRAREEAAPGWLQGRVVRGEALPDVEVVGQAGQHEEEEQEEVDAVCEWLVTGLADDLFVEVMEGLWYRRWVTREGEEEEEEEEKDEDEGKEG